MPPARESRPAPILNRLVAEPTGALASMPFGGELRPRLARVLACGRREDRLRRYVRPQLPDREGPGPKKGDPGQRVAGLLDRAAKRPLKTAFADLRGLLEGETRPVKRHPGGMGIPGRLLLQ